MLFITACEYRFFKKPITIGYSAYNGYELFELAQSESFYNSQEIMLAQFQNNSDVLRAFRNKLLDVAATSLENAIDMLEHDNDIRIILILGSSNGTDIIAVKNNITSIKDVIGKKIVYNTTSHAALMLAELLKSSGVNYQNVDIIPTLSTDLRFVLEEESNVELVATTIGFLPTLKKLGFDKIISSSKNAPDTYFNVLVARGEVYNDLTLLGEIAQGYYDALYFFRTQKEKAFAILRNSAIAANEYGDKDFTFNDFKFYGEDKNVEMLGDRAEMFTTIAAREAIKMKELGLMLSDVNVSHLLACDYAYLHTGKN